ncbi:MAG: serine/threonine protein kinase [Stackebrandtia sp.]
MLGALRVQSGQTLGGRYRLDSRVGTGGMGEVWRGTDTSLDRTVAVKVMHPGLSDDETFRRRFQGEAHAIAALQAPGVVNIYDYGEELDGDSAVSYLVMEFVDGRALSAILKERGTLGWEETFDVLAEAADALHAAHQAGIVHRDVKPGNILVDSEQRGVKIVDFGIARTAGGVGLTQSGAVMGTAEYVSPEQLSGQEPTGASDVYSLGVVAYECLSGRRPFDSDTPATVIAGHLHSAPPPLSEDVPPAVAAIVMRALEKDPAQRWQTAQSFAEACRSRRGPDSGTTPSAGIVVPVDGSAVTEALSVPAAPPRKNGRLRTALVVLVTLALGLVGGVVLAGKPWESPEASAPPTADDSTSPTPSESVEESEEDPVPQDEADDPVPDDPPSSDDLPEFGVVPDVTGRPEADARSMLEQAGFANISVNYWGDESGWTCPVDRQDPVPQTEHQLDQPVAIWAEVVADGQSDDDCGKDGDPGGGGQRALGLSAEIPLRSA